MVEAIIAAIMLYACYRAAQYVFAKQQERKAKVALVLSLARRAQANATSPVERRYHGLILQILDKSFIERDRIRAKDIGYLKGRLNDLRFLVEYRRANGIANDGYDDGISTIQRVFEEYLATIEEPIRAAAELASQEEERSRQQEESRRAEGRKSRALSNRLTTIIEAARVLKAGSDQAGLLNTIDDELREIEADRDFSPDTEMKARIVEALFFLESRLAAAAIDDAILMNRSARVRQRFSG